MAKGISLHIGINRCDPEHYDGWEGPLEFCEADAEAVHGIAASMGYESSLLLTDKATIGAVTAAIADAARALAPGDIFLLSYAGHGGQIPDQRKGVYRDEKDHADETWCLHDGQLSDDEQEVLYAAFDPGVRILVVSDSCHSGTVTRGRVDARFAAMSDAEKVARFGTTEPRFRFMPRNVAIRVHARNSEFYDSRRRALPEHKPELRASVQLLSGCQDDELSREDWGHGLFTQAILDVWDAGSFEGGYGDFHEAILERMPEEQRPNWFKTGPTNAAFETERPFSI